MEIKEIVFHNVADPRGCLTSIEAEFQEIPIEVKRVFYMHHVTEDRGGHAHIDTDQVIIPISGSFRLRLSDGKEPRGVYVPRLTFTDLIDFTPDAVCLVLANTHYDMGKSLLSYDAYLKYLQEHGLL